MRINNIYALMEIKGCATCYEGQSTAEVHLITSFINSSKRNEIGVGHRINIQGWRFIFFQFSSVQQEFLSQNLVIWKTRSCSVC